MANSKWLQVIMSLCDEFKRYRVSSTPALLNEFDSKALQQMSKNMMRELDHVPLTPLAQNANEEENGADNVLALNAPIQGWESQFIYECVQLAQKHGYLDDKPGGLKAHYANSVRRNLLKMGREVTPGAGLRRMDNLEKYFHDFTFNVKRPELWDKAMELTMKGVRAYHSIAHLDTWPAGWLPFSGSDYDTNVGYPSFHNAATMNKGKSYGDIAREQAKKLDPRDLPALPYTIGGRDQRSGFKMDNLADMKADSLKGQFFEDSKARLIMPSSRAGNIWVQKIIRSLIDYVKENVTIFFGYRDSTQIARMMQSMSKFCHAKGYSLQNIDYSSFDTTVSPELRASACIIVDEMLKTELGKLINHQSVLWGLKGPIWYYVTGGQIRKRFRFGTIGSGENRTNFDGGLCNALATTYAALCVDENFSKLYEEMLNAGLSPMLVMGDDNLFPINSDNADQILKEMSIILEEELGMEMNPTKVEQSMFLQKFTDETLPDGQYWTPFPRVMSKMMWLERDKGLDEYAWTIANWMKIWECRFNPEVGDMIRLLAKYDKTKLGLQRADGTSQSVNDFMNGLRSSSAEVGKADRSRLREDDPNKSINFDEKGDVTSDFITTMWDLVKQALSNNGERDFDENQHFIEKSEQLETIEQSVL